MKTEEFTGSVYHGGERCDNCGTQGSCLITDASADGFSRTCIECLELQRIDYEGRNPQHTAKQQLIEEALDWCRSEPGDEIANRDFFAAAIRFYKTLTNEPAPRVDAKEWQ